MTNNTKDTVIAFVRLACMGLTSMLAAYGVAVDVDILYNVVTIALFFAALIWGWWKDNNVTKAATDAHEFVELFKNTVPRCDMDGDDDGDEA